MAGIAALAAVEISLHRIEFAHDAAGMSQESNPILGEARLRVERAAAQRENAPPAY
jgi:hypothetical protein